MDRGIWVRGTGTASGPRDECVLTLGAESRAPSAQAAMAATAAAAQGMRSALLAAGLDEALATSAVSLTPFYDDYPTVAGYEGSVRMAARSRDLAAVGDVLAAVVAAGGDAARIHEVAFQHADPSALMALARERAWGDAHGRASQLAALAGRALGDVLAIDETGGRPPVPVRMAAAAQAAAAGAVPVDGGEGSVEVSLTVGWSLR